MMSNALQKILTFQQLVCVYNYFDNLTILFSDLYFQLNFQILQPNHSFRVILIQASRGIRTADVEICATCGQDERMRDGLLQWVTLRKEKTVEKISSLCSARDWETERDQEKERVREREIEDCWENADPHSRNARYSGGIARNCCTSSASFLDCRATRLFSFLFSCSSSQLANRPTV